MLTAIGESPISSLNGTTSASVAIAENVLDEVNRSVQSIGWHFNTEYDIELSPDSVTKKISTPGNALRVEVPRTSTTDYVERNGHLYDVVEHSYTFDSSIKKITIVYMREWDETPQAFRHYVTVRAAKTLHDRLLGTNAAHVFSREDEYAALSALKRHDMRGNEYSIFESYDMRAYFRTPNALWEV